ncbi:hypothetical protein ZWY2020_054835 [Hordeum vulgare]|nr:hypothetical protein ZWY2020_054835 [Hordeum vulgare]
MALSSGVGDGGADGGVGDGPTTLDELYHINSCRPSCTSSFARSSKASASASTSRSATLLIKPNSRFYNLEVNDFEAKVVLKPLDFDRKWRKTPLLQVFTHFKLCLLFPVVVVGTGAPCFMLAICKCGSHKPPGFC